MNNVSAAGRAGFTGQHESADFFVYAAARLEGPTPSRSPRLRKIVDEMRQNNWQRAESRLREELERRPSDADAVWLLALAAAQIGRADEAEALHARCLELLPDFTAARFERAKLLFRQHRYSEALCQLEYLLMCSKSNRHLLQLKAAILGTMGDQSQALAIREQLATENPDRAECWTGLADALRAAGHQEKCIAAYRRAIDCHTSCGLAWWGLADLKTFRFSDADIAAMHRGLDSTDTVAEDRLRLLFALGKAYEDRRDYARSFEQYARANAVKRLRKEYDWGALDARVAAEKTLFTPEFLRRRSPAAGIVAKPIFILGQPRSGSTLVEQILSSHSSVEGLGELPYISDMARRLVRQAIPAGSSGYFGTLAKLSSGELAALGEEYLRSVHPHRRYGRPLFTDKSPANYQHVGLILMILPDAKIIDVRRHPAACCLSMFKQNFGRNNLRLRELGRMYRSYVQSMAHFDRVSPGRVRRIFYEQLIAEPKAEIRKVLDDLELPFEDACLNFHETDRAILTPSSEQVRRPISGDAADQWRRFEPWLGPLFESLGAVLAEYPLVPEELR